jgi:DHA2 family multidrug resistance protein
MSNALPDEERNPLFSIFILTLATFMAQLDSSVVNVSLPKMAGDLSVTPSELVWVIGAYLVATAAIVPISGWLASDFGRKRYYMASVAVFTVSSVLCGLATNLESLVFFRIIQGLSGGGLAASEQAIIADITPPDKLGRAFSIYAFGLAAAPVMGPTLGGFITDTLSWHWVFFINLPIGIISLILTSLFVYESEGAQEARRKFFREGKTIDWLGILLFVGGIALLVWVLEQGPKVGWLDSDYIVFAGFAAFLMLLIGIGWEYYQDKPAVDVMMFANRGFTGAAVLIFAVAFVLQGSGFLMSYLAQVVLGYTAMNAGMISLPGTLIQMCAIQLIGYVTDKTDVRKIIFLGLVASTLAVWNLASFNLNVDFYTLATARALQLLSLSFLAATINTSAYYGLPPEKNNSASALMNLARTMGSSLGVALTSTILAVQTQTHINNFSYHTNNFNPNFTQAVRELTVNFAAHGLTNAQAIGAAYGVVWQTVLAQASMKAFLDAVGVYFILFLLVLPLVFLLKAKPAAK